MCVREQTDEERIDCLVSENSRLIDELQKLASENEMLKDTIVRLAMKIVGVTN